ncbi:SRPBCC family protein [Streptomyces sp. NPDC056452]|uniref:SRPBCC family protein n=1 Tax=Streptomyces sp. NPDC056452 TaxID=3345821 RepID=UPI0036B0CB69
MTSTSRSARIDDDAATTPPRRRRRLPAVLGALAALLAGYSVWANVHPVRLEASTEIEATPEEVWRVLTDVSAYAQWNPFMTSAEVTSPGGRLEEGARMRIVMHDDTGDSTFTPEILTVTPDEELRWLGKMGPGWIADGEHRFTIEELGSGRVRLTQSERFTGIAVPFFEGRLKSDTLPQFRAMNEHLAQRAEALGR